MCSCLFWRALVFRVGCECDSRDFQKNPRKDLAEGYIRLPDQIAGSSWQRLYVLPTQWYSVLRATIGRWPQMRGPGGFFSRQNHNDTGGGTGIDPIAWIWVLGETVLGPFKCKDCFRNTPSLLSWHTDDEASQNFTTTTNLSEATRTLIDWLNQARSSRKPS
jgi:hypothetical protein